MPEPRKTITLVLGGARSGKSRGAQKLAAGFKRVTLIATARASDPELRQRIAEHRRQRPSFWKTVEAPENLASAICRESQRADVLLIDCLTLFVANALSAKNGKKSAPERVLSQARRVCRAMRAANSSVISVSNEVGSGIVPAFPSGRIFRDLLGEINQQVAEIADRVVLMVAGMPLMLKDRTGPLH